VHKKKVQLSPKPDLLQLQPTRTFMLEEERDRRHQSNETFLGEVPRQKRSRAGDWEPRPSPLGVGFIGFGAGVGELTLAHRAGNGGSRAARQTTGWKPAGPNHRRGTSPTQWLADRRCSFDFRQRLPSSSALAGVVTDAGDLSFLSSG
jgi:hypothetical protein